MESETQLTKQIHEKVVIHSLKVYLFQKRLIKLLNLSEYAFVCSSPQGFQIGVYRK